MGFADIELTPDRMLFLWEHEGRKNYEDWRDCYEHSGLDDLPILKCETCFNAFTKEYSLGRNLKAGKPEQVMKRLKDGFVTVTGTNEVREQGNKLVELATGIPGANGVLRSLASKVAMFADANQFLPFDQFSSRGLSVLQRTKFQPYDLSLKRSTDKTDALCKFHILARRIVDATEPEAKCAYKRLGKNRPRACRVFHNRVVDLYLMVLGGRYEQSVSPFNKCHKWQSGCADPATKLQSTEERAELKQRVPKRRTPCGFRCQPTGKA